MEHCPPLKADGIVSGRTLSTTPTPARDLSGGTLSSLAGIDLSGGALSSLAGIDLSGEIVVPCWDCVRAPVYRRHSFPTTVQTWVRLGGSCRCGVSWWWKANLLCDTANVITNLLCDTAKVITNLLCDTAKVITNLLSDTAKVITNLLCDTAKVITNRLCDTAKVITLFPLWKVNGRMHLILYCSKANHFRPNFEKWKCVIDILKRIVLRFTTTFG